jgi:hypothetical protein
MWKLKKNKYPNIILNNKRRITMQTEQPYIVEVIKENNKQKIRITIDVDEFEANSGLSMTVASTRGIKYSGTMYNNKEMFFSVHCGYKLDLTPQEHERLTNESKQRKIQRAKDILLDNRIEDDYLLRKTKKTPVIDNYWTQDKNNMPVRVA